MSSLVTAVVRSVSGKITRSGLETRRSRPPASTMVSRSAGIPGSSTGPLARAGSGPAGGLVRKSRDLRTGPLDRGAGDRGADGDVGGPLGWGAGPAGGVLAAAPGAPYR